MSENSKHREIREKCIKVLRSQGYTVDTSHEDKGDVRIYREYNGEKIALAGVDIVGIKKGAIQMIVEIEEDDTAKTVLGNVAVADMATICLARTADSDRKMVPLNGVVLFIVTPASKERAEERAKKRAAIMMLRDSYNFMNGSLRDFIVTDEDEFEDEINEMALYVV
ncbi:MAG: hypothetical protein ISS94_00880 [Candidatus Syntrophoarchaeum sp.]|nr:hypothetical protein [Candidatus Syntrophoarchaeum sp.]